MKRQTVEQAAKASWLLPLICFALNLVARNGGRDVGFYMGIFSFFMYLVALGCGIFALCMIPRFGREKILVDAIVGTILSTLVVCFFIAAIVFIASHRT